MHQSETHVTSNADSCTAYAETWATQDIYRSANIVKSGIPVINQLNAEQNLIETRFSRAPRCHDIAAFSSLPLSSFNFGIGRKLASAEI